jgi:hypothetical protein
MTAENRPRLRVLIGASSFADAAAALKILKPATHRLAMTLGGMLIVDQQVLALCRMPNQRIVSTTGVLAIAPSPGQVSALIEADAKAFRRSLEDLAVPIGAQWMFEQTMGDLISDSLRFRADWDVIVLGHRAIHVARGKIVVIAGEGPRNEELTKFAETLAAQSAADRLDLIVGEGASTAGGAHPAFATAETALDALSRTSARAVLLDMSNGLLHDAADLQRLLDAARCPVFLFGAASPGSKL